MFRVNEVEGGCVPCIKSGSLSLDCTMLHAHTFSLKDLYIGLLCLHLFFVSSFISCFCYCLFLNFVLCLVVHF
jgi:hypothetical protein